jgi:UDP-N-acetylmuramoylalanine--D-glutamate ligase
MNLERKRALVVGLGRSGEAAAKFLAARGAQVAATDAKTEDRLGAVVGELRSLGVRLYLGGHDPELFHEQDLIVVSPGVPWNLQPLAGARGRGIEVIGEVELAARFLKGPVIGITGSNGKTTTTALTGHLLRHGGMRVQVGGNIGQPYPPVISMVETSDPEMWNVIELSSFQLESIRTFHANIAVALNVTPDHLDRHGSFEQYAAAKAKLFSTQGPQDVAILNADDQTCVGYAGQTQGKVVWFSRTHAVDCGAWVEGDCIVFSRADRKILLADAATIPIRGAHNLENMLAAAAAAFLAGENPEAIRRAAPEFQAVEHRLEFVRRVNGVDYYNDSKATNVDAARKALEAFDGNVWVILGGKDKGGDYTVLRELLRRKAKGGLLVGAAAEIIARQIGDAVPLVEAGTVERAVAYASEHAVSGDTVLLAPACASFDQFENYEHRGRVFKQVVRALAGREDGGREAGRAASWQNH